MAQNLNIALPKETWTQLSNADITAITFQNIGQDDIVVMGTASAVAPTDVNDGIRYAVGYGEANKSLADLFPGITAVRVYAYAVGAAGGAFVSHA